MLLHISGTQKKKLTISDTQRKMLCCTQKNYDGRKVTTFATNLNS